MAIYHFSAKVISRARGSSALASAAYRSASRLRDERLNRHHDFTHKTGVVHSEVLAPEGVSDELHDRERLWNAVEAAEKRRDAQLAREIEFAIPRELSQEQGIELARSFVAREFVARGMIADLNIHWDIGKDGLPKPHAHVMLTTRSVDEHGFGAKVRDWNRTQLLKEWRAAWGTHVNERLAELGLEARIDHRSFKEQGIDLDPQHKIGPAAARMAAEGLEADRLEEHREIARDNGSRILANPALALDAITRQQATFTRRDLARFVHRHSDGLDQFNRVMAAVEGAPDLVRLGKDGRGEERFTSREMMAVEERLYRASDRMALRSRHAVPERAREGAVERAERRGLVLSREQRAALAHVTDRNGIGIVIGYAGAGKSVMLGVAREAWENSGYRVRGVALSGIAAENLQSGSGIAAGTIASLEYNWVHGREQLSAKDVLVVDEAGMIGSRQLERVLGEADRTGAKVVLVGDPEQLQAIEAGAAFRSLSERHPHAEIGEIRRQREAWQRDATRQLATGRTSEALDAYRAHGMVHAAVTREEARGALIAGWEGARRQSPETSRLILTHTNDDVRALNRLARARLKEAGELGTDVAVQTERGGRLFAAGERVMFLKNERGLGVKNGSLGTIAHVSPEAMTVRLDGGRSIAFELRDYAHLDHGYAATIHKSQGVTVDEVHVLATSGFDRHAAYVALSRHRAGIDLHYGRDDFVDERKLARVLSRDRGKDMASDYEPEMVRSQHGRFAERLTASSPGAAKEQGIFANFRPRARAIELERPMQGKTPKPQSDLSAAVSRYATATAEIARMRGKDLPVLSEQRTALSRAGAELDRIRPGGSEDLASVFAQSPELIAHAATGRTQAAILALTAQTQTRIALGQRAERFISGWQALQLERARFEHRQDWIGAGAVRARMDAMARGLERDPQMETALKGRRHELGLERSLGRSLADDLMEQLGRGMGRGRGRELGMEL